MSVLLSGSAPDARVTLLFSELPRSFSHERDGFLGRDATKRYPVPVVVKRVTTVEVGNPAEGVVVVPHPLSNLLLGVERHGRQVGAVFP